MLFSLLLMDVFQKVVTMVHEYVQGENFEEDDAGPQAGFEEEQIRELVETQQADLSSLFSFLDLETGSKVHEFADQSSS